MRRAPDWVWIGLLFLVGLLPALASPAAYHGDERFYTDAALAMERSGELLPRYADGQPRLNKPLLTYALVAASHQVLGIGLWQSRLPFALAGALLVMATGRLASRLLRERGSAALAALIVASNPDVLTLATRSTPDVLVCLGALLALGGAAHVLDPARSPARSAYAFWIGAGLATAAKGLWGPLLVGFVLLGSLARPEWRTRARALLRPVPACLGLALGAAGVLPLFTAGASAVLEQGAQDQLRAAFTPSVALRNLREYLPALAIHLLPWTVVLGLALLTRDGRRASRAALRTPLARTTLVFWVVLACVFLFASSRRVRYLAPALAPLALPLAAVLVDLARQAGSRAIVRSVCGVLAGTGSLLALGCALVLIRWRPWDALALLAPAGVAGFFAARALRGDGHEAPLALGWSALALALGGLGVARPALAVAPFSAIASAITSRGEPATLALVDLEPSLGARLRLLSGGRIELRDPPADPPAPTDARAQPHFVLVARAGDAAWRARGYAPAGEFDAPGYLDASDLLRWLRGETAEPERSEAEPLVLLASPR